MDAQHIIDALFGTCGLLMGAILKTLWADLKAMSKSMTDLNEKISREYVRRDDYRDDIGEIKAGIVRIYDKLEEKADRS